MKISKISLYLLLTLLFFSSFLMIGNCYSTENSYNDAGADSTQDTDILTVWIDNTNSFLQFKVELNDSWSFLPFYRIYAFISVDPSTGNSYGGADFNVDYVLDFYPSSTEDRINFIDTSDNSNNLDQGEEVGMAFSIVTNNNKTIEFGWKLRTSHEGKGYLDISDGQTIQIKFYAGGDSDYAPDIGLDPLNYTLILINPNIPGYNTIMIITSSITAILVVAIIRRVRKK